VADNWMVFAFTHLLGIQLMPRIRNWKDLHFYRPERAPSTATSTACSPRWWAGS
jgi:TnpA family transposase